MSSPLPTRLVKTLSTNWDASGSAQNRRCNPNQPIDWIRVELWLPVETLRRVVAKRTQRAGEGSVIMKRSSGLMRMLGVAGAAACVAAVLQAVPSSAGNSSVVAAFDCSGDPPGMLQSINIDDPNSPGDRVTVFKKLDVKMLTFHYLSQSHI